MAVAPAPTSAGVLGMVRTTRVPSGSRASMAADRHAGGDRDDQRRRLQVRRDLVEHLGQDLRLDREHDDLGVAHDVGVVRGRVDAVARLHLVGALAARIGAVDLRRLDHAGGDEPLDERLGHVAGAEKSDRLGQLHG